MLLRNIAFSAILALSFSQTAFAEGTAVAFGGLKADTSLPVEVKADTLAVDQVSGQASFTGNVLVVQGEMRLSADEVRVEYAKELLRSGKCPPEELPQRCGFLSRSAFYAAFKKVTGVSPKRYMKYGQREKLSEPTEYV